MDATPATERDLLTAQAPAPRARALLARTLPPTVVFLLTLALWEGATRAFKVPTFLLPPPSEIALKLVEKQELLLRTGLFTFQEALLGFIVGCGLGMVTALAVGRWRILSDALMPFAVAASAVPIIALAPIANNWLGGVEMTSKVAVTALICFFPTLVSTYRGLTSVPPAALELMHAYAAPELTIFLKLRFPHALPYIFSALKVCTTLSMIGALVAEFFSGPVTKMLGAYIRAQAGVSATREAWAGIVVACGLTLAFYLVVVLIERRVLPWHVSQRQPALS